MYKSALFVSYDGMTDPLGQSQVIPYLIGLRKAGHHISIVSAEKKERFLKQGAAIQQLLADNHIDWYPVSYSKGIPVIAQYATYNRLLKKSMVLHKKKSFDLVHCRSYIPSLIGLKLKRRFGVKFIFDMRGFWADERVEGGIWNMANPLFRTAYNFFKKKEKEFLTESDAIISLTENAKSEILSWKGINIHDKKITVIPCCADLDFFSEKNIDAVKQQQLKQALSISEANYVLCYCGSAGTWYLLDEMLQFFSCLLARQPRALFLIITPDDERSILLSAAKFNIGKEKIVVRSATREQMPSLISLSDASVFFIKNSYSKKASSPTKMGELMGMGIPVVCNAGIGDVDEIMIHSHAGILINTLNKESYDAAAKKLLATKFSGEEIRAAAFINFSLKDGIARYHNVYDAL